MRLLPLFALLIAAMGDVAAAPAADTLRLLHREPLSLLDWGIYQMEVELQSVRRSDKDFIRVYYVPQSQHIRIDAVFLVSQAEVDAISPRATCYVRHHAIKLTLGIIDTDRLNIAPAAEFRLGAKFSHQNSDAYPDSPDASEIGTALLGLVDVHVGISAREDEFPFVQVMRCDGLALSQEVSYHAPTTEDITPR